MSARPAYVTGPHKRRSVAISTALHLYHDGRLPVPIEYGTKGPPQGFLLKNWLASWPTESELIDAFRGDNREVAVALGEPSGGLTCRDFDDLGSYRRWASSFPALARVLPTVVTRRGRHVYFTATSHEVRSYSRSGGVVVKFGDGELLHGGHALWPPSHHPTGVRYQWTTDRQPDDFPFVSDLADAGLIPADFTLSRAGVSQDVVLPENGGSWEATSVEQAIELTLPTGKGQRHYGLFRLVRHLKSIPETADSAPSELKPIVREWYWRASQITKMKASFGATWIDFLDGWKNVRHPVGEKLRSIASRAGVSQDVVLPENGGSTTDGSMRDRFHSLCQALQEEAGDRPFYLAQRAAAEVLGCSQKTISKWTGKAIGDGRLKLVTPCDRINHRAAEYRFDVAC